MVRWRRSYLIGLVEHVGMMFGSTSAACVEPSRQPGWKTLAVTSNMIVSKKVLDNPKRRAT